MKFQGLNTQNHGIIAPEAPSTSSFPIAYLKLILFSQEYYNSASALVSPRLEKFMLIALTFVKGTLPAPHSIIATEITREDQKPKTHPVSNGQVQPQETHSAEFKT